MKELLKDYLELYEKLEKAFDEEYTDKSVAVIATLAYEIGKLQGIGEAQGVDLEMLLNKF